MKKAFFNLNNDDELIAYLEKTNPTKKPMTIDRLRTYPGCENYADEQAESIIKLLKELAAIIIGDTMAKESICIDNQYVVNLESGTENNLKRLNPEPKNKAA